METVAQPEFLQVTDPIAEWKQKSSSSDEMYVILTEVKSGRALAPVIFIKVCVNM